MLQITKQIGVLVTGQLGKLVLNVSPAAAQCVSSVLIDFLKAYCHDTL